MTQPDPPESLGVGRQFEIYRAGLGGHQPTQAIALEELEQQAKQVLSTEAYDYLAGGAGAEDTMRANLAAFRRWRLIPRMLRNVSRRSLSVDLLGHRLPAPILLAPIGVQSILHRQAEVAVARAASSLGIPIVLSTVSSKPLEEVAAAMGPVPHWFQLYWPSHAELAASLLKRAERSGYSAIVVTLDTFLLAWRERDLQNAYLPFLLGEGLANYFSDPVYRAALRAPPENDPAAAIQYFAKVFSNSALTWEDLPFLRRHTRLPILLKGILHPGDAQRALDCGVSGIIVSNHGGRQVDGAVAALDALPQVVDRVGGQVPVLFDSGIRRGSDVLKALALGAQAVLLGRPYCYGLAAAGEFGVREVLKNLLADLDLTLGLIGCSTPAELHRDQLVASPP